MKFVGRIVLLLIGTLPVTSFREADEMRYTRPIPNLSASFNSLDSGKLLAQKYCQGCHLLPDPSLLDKKTWVNSVLPNMALRLGIRTVGTDPYADLPEVEIKAIRPLGIYPETAVLSDPKSSTCCCPASRLTGNATTATTLWKVRSGR